MESEEWRIVMWVPHTDNQGDLMFGHVVSVETFLSKAMAIRFALGVGATGRPIVKAGARTYNVEISIQ